MHLTHHNFPITESQLRPDVSPRLVISFCSILLILPPRGRRMCSRCLLRLKGFTSAPLKGPSQTVGYHFYMPNDDLLQDLLFYGSVTEHDHSACFEKSLFPGSLYEPRPGRGAGLFVRPTLRR